MNTALRVELAPGFLNRWRWLGYGVLMSFGYFALKVLERVHTGHPDWLSDGIKGRLNDVAYLVFVASVLAIYSICRAFECGRVVDPQLAVTFGGLRAWIGLTLLGWVVYIVSIATMYDKGTFLKMTLDLPVRIIQTIEGILNLAAIAVAYGFVCVGWRLADELQAAQALIAGDRAKERAFRCASNSLRRTALAISTANAILGLVYLVVAREKILAGFQQGNWVLGVILYTIIMWGVFFVLWLHVRRRLP